MTHMSAFIRVQDGDGTLWSIPVENISVLTEEPGRKCDIHLGRDGASRICHTLVSLIEVEQAISRAKFDEMEMTARKTMEIAKRFAEEV